MADLSTTYLGIPLRNPVVASSSSLTGSVESIERLEQAGVGAVVLKSLFEEQVDLEARKISETLDMTTDVDARSVSFFEDIPLYNDATIYLQLIEKARAAVQIPVIASLSCTSRKRWVEYARQIEGAGASALELNLYSVQTDPQRTAQQVEAEYLDVVSEVRAAVKLPLDCKISPFFSSIPHIVAQLAARGADGVSLFNRFYQPDLDLENLTSLNRIELSRPADALLPMRWIALLYGRIPNLQFAATSGIHDGMTALKVIAAGAQVAMVCSTLFKNKPAHVGVILEEMQRWLTEKQYGSVDELRGVLSQKTSPNLHAYERAQYIKALVGYE